MARIGNRNPKEHVMIVTGTFGYVIVVVESIDHAVHCTVYNVCSLVGGILVTGKGLAAWRVGRSHPLEICCCGSLVGNDAKHQTGEDTRDPGTVQELGQILVVRM